MRVITVECLTDNYSYLLVGSDARAVVIDPSEAAPVNDVLTREGLTLSAIWLTHHHWDHVGGVEALCSAHPDLPVLGSAYDASQQRIAQQTRGLTEADTLMFDGQAVRVLEVPGHTLGAIAFVVGDCLFTGDTLFLGGCGRVFEGTMPQMQSSLAKLCALKPTLLVYPGHEYTVSNLRFGATIEPNNQQITARLTRAQADRANGQPTVPGRLSDELATNVLLRWDAADVVARANSGTQPADVFGAIRRAKDTF